MQVNFYYKNKPSSTDYEIIIAEICNRAALLIPLPHEIDVIFARLHHSTYGGIDTSKSNCLVLSTNLNLKSIPTILVHELIHISQRHTKMLQIYNDGSYTWMGKFYLRQNPETLPREEYLNLPWEVDVSTRLPILLEKILDTDTVVC